MELGKLILEDDKTLYTLTQLRKGTDNMVTMVVQLRDGEDAWLAELNTSYLERNSKRVGLSLDGYSTAIQLLFKNSFNSSHQNEEQYKCQFIQHDHDTAALLWKKKITGDDIFLKMGTIELRRQPLSHVIDQMLAFSVNHIDEINKNLQSTKMDVERLAEERKSALQLLEQCVEAKERLEVDLYSKFSLILNEKKRKIRELLGDEDILEDNPRSQERPGTSKVSSNFQNDISTRETILAKRSPSTGTLSGAALHVDNSPISEQQVTPLPRKSRIPRSRAAIESAKEVTITESKKSREEEQEILAVCEMDTLELAEEL